MCYIYVNLQTVFNDHKSVMFAHLVCVITWTSVQTHTQIETNVVFILLDYIFYFIIVIEMSPSKYKFLLLKSGPAC